MRTLKLFQTLLTLLRFMWQSTIGTPSSPLMRLQCCLHPCLHWSNVCPNFENIRVLCRHFEQALQRLPCPQPQSTLHGWKGIVMAWKLYALLTPNPFHLPNTWAKRGIRQAHWPQQPWGGAWSCRPSYTNGTGYHRLNVYTSQELLYVDD